MRLGAIIPNEGPVVADAGLAAMARAAESAGADSLWVSDHLLMVDVESSDYPFAEDGRPTWSLATDYYEALTCCAFLAAATEHCRIGTAVLIGPQRHLLELAKMTATIDRLTGGRLSVGIGAGWNGAEMRALGFDPATRGARLDELMSALRSCWGGRPRPYAGRHVTVPPDVLLFPTPVQQGGPPLLVGGTSDAALRRAVRSGDGWMGIAFVDRFDSETLAGQVARLRDLRADAAPRPFATVLKLHAAATDASEVPSLLPQVVEMGFDEVIVEPPWTLGVSAGAALVEECRSVAVP